MPHAPSLSIVIPAPDDTPALEETLLSVLENRPDDCEVIVALGCPYDDPWNVATEGVRFVQAPRGDLVACVTVGIAASTGDVVHLLAAGWKATPGWTERALALFADDTVGAVSPVAVATDDPDRIVSRGVRYKRGGRRVLLKRAGAGPVGADGRVGARRSAVVEGPRIEAGFWRGGLVRDVRGGVSTVCGSRLADVDLAVEMAARGVVARVAEDARVVAGVEPGREGAFRAGLHGERLFWRSLAGRSLVPALLLHAVEILRHAVVAAPVGTLPMLFGRLVAALQVGSYLPRYRRLLALQAESAAAEQTAAGGDNAGSIGVEREAGVTIRIDRGSDLLTGPHRTRDGVQESRPLRKSA